MLGKISPELCELIVHEDFGLFPSQEEISFTCNCTDYAELCPHVAASLCGVVVLFDQDPKLFFKLRGLAAEEILLEKPEAQKSQDPLQGTDLSKLFGIDLQQ